MTLTTIAPGARNPVNVGINGKLASYLAGMTFDADAATTEALGNAGIPLVQPLAGGQVLISGTGSFVHGAINGVPYRFPVGVAFVPTAAQLIALAVFQTGAFGGFVVLAGGS